MRINNHKHRYIYIYSMLIHILFIKDIADTENHVLTICRDSLPSQLKLFKQFR